MYYLLSSSEKPRRRVGSSPFVKGISWWRGAVISTTVPQPLEFELNPYQPASPDEDQHMAAIIYTNPPLWRDDFIKALQDCGVNNFDTYEVQINNPSNASTLADLRAQGITYFDDSYLDQGGVITNYKAVNVLGLVAAADMSKSIATVHDGIPLIDVDFDELVIDEKKTLGIKLFRLAESNNAILIHESVRDYLISKGFGNDVAFYDLKEAAI